MFVLERISKRHPELSAQDIEEAWCNAIAYAPRNDARPFEYLAVGFDAKGRALEMVGRRNADGDWVIWHAFTPPTAKALKELGLRR